MNTLTSSPRCPKRINSIVGIRSTNGAKACAIALGALLAVATPTHGFTITQDAGSMATAVLPVSGTNYTVTLDPRPVTALAAGATAAQRTLLNNTFDGFDAAGNADNTVDWTFTAGAALAGTVTIAQYDAATRSNPTERGGAIMDLSYNGTGAPTNLRWIQIIQTTHPLGGATSPYVDPTGAMVGGDDNLPFYFTNNEIANGFNWNTPADSSVPYSNAGSPRVIQNPAAGTDLVFLDFSTRFLTSAPVDWDAFLYLTTWDQNFGGTVTIHDGLRWGFTIVVPEPSTVVLIALGLVAVVTVRRRSSKGSA